MGEALTSLPKEGDSRPDSMGGTQIYWQGRWCDRDVARARGWAGPRLVDLSPSLPVLDLAKWTDEEPPERAWLVPGLIPYGCVTSLYGDGGAGKSMLALILMAVMANRYEREWLGERPLGFKSVGLFAEDDGDELARRVKRVCAAYDLDYGRCAQDMKLVPAVGMDATLAGFTEFGLATTPMMDSIVSLVQTEGASLLVLDYAAALFGGNEVDRAQVSEFMRRLNAIARDLDVAILLLGHPSMSGMSGGRGTSGSTAWRNQSRSFLHLSVDENQTDPDGRTLLTLTHTKCNYGRAGRSFSLAFDGSRFDILEASERVEKPKGPRLTTAQTVCLDALKMALDHFGELHKVTPARIEKRCVSVAKWRELAYSAGVSGSDDEDSRRRAFYDTRKALQAKGIVGRADDLAWLA